MRGTAAVSAARPHDAARRAPRRPGFSFAVGVERALREHAVAALPEEACGILVGVGVEGGWRLTRSIRCANVAPASSRPRRFEIDPGVVIRTRRELRGGDETIIGFYHSHPNGRCEMSATDLEYARNWPRTLWIVVPVADGSAGAPCAWQLDAPAAAPTPVPLITAAESSG